MSETPETIAHLARKCANANLRMAHAVDLFVALYLADAVGLERGNITHAADRAGIARTSFIRRIRKQRGRHDQSDPQ